jgi:hypothetical protein
MISSIPVLCFGVLDFAASEAAIESGHPMIAQVLGRL